MGARVLAVFVLAEFSILLAFGLVTLFKGGGPEGLGAARSFSPSAALQGAPGVAVMFAVASMFGFEATAIYGEEAKEPKKTVPRATYLSVVVVTGFFHHQHVDRLGEGLRVTARAADGTVEAVELSGGDGRFMAVQWHPEDTAHEDPAQQRLFDALVRAAHRSA
jgi:hypothetical protein